jgi:hypothetical protein
MNSGQMYYAHNFAQYSEYIVTVVCMDGWYEVCDKEEGGYMLHHKLEISQYDAYYISTTTNLTLVTCSVCCRSFFCTAALFPFLPLPLPLPLPTLTALLINSEFLFGECNSFCNSLLAIK